MRNQLEGVARARTEHEQLMRSEAKTISGSIKRVRGDLK